MPAQTTSSTLHQACAASGKTYAPPKAFQQGSCDDDLQLPAQHVVAFSRRTCIPCIPCITNRTRFPRRAQWCMGASTCPCTALPLATAAKHSPAPLHHMRLCKSTTYVALR